MNETIALRARAGLTFVDAVTSATVSDGLTVTVAGASLAPNRSGVYAVFAGTAPTLDVTVVDAKLRYLPRRATVTVPANPTTTARITLFPSAARSVAPNWAVVRVSVVAAGTLAGLPWSSVSVARASDGKALASGIADARGEALLAVQGVSRRTNGSPATPPALAATVTAWFDPAVTAEPAGWIPDPSTFKAATDPSVKRASAPVTLAAGTTVPAQLSISV